MGSGALQYRDKRVVANWGLDAVRPPFPYIFDDFLGDTANADLWLIDSPQATGGTDFAINTAGGDPVAAHGGWIVGTTGTGDDDNENIAGELLWRADRATKGRMLVFETRLSVPTITTVRVQAGLTDAKSEAAFALGASDAITSTATDAAVWIVDTDADSDDWFGLNVDTNTDGALVGGGQTVTAETATVLRIEIDSSGNCFYYFSDAESESHQPTLVGSDTEGVTETVALAPFANVTARAGSAARSLEIDYLFVCCGR